MRTSLLTRAGLVIAAAGLGAGTLAAPAQATSPVVTQAMVLRAVDAMKANSSSASINSLMTTIVGHGCHIAPAELDIVAGNVELVSSAEVEGVLFTMTIRSIQDRTPRSCTFAALAPSNSGSTFTGKAVMTVNSVGSPTPTVATGTSALSGNVAITPPIGLPTDVRVNNATLAVDGTTVTRYPVTTTTTTQTPKSKAKKKAAKNKYVKKLKAAKRSYSKAFKKAGSNKAKRAAAKKAYAAKRSSAKRSYRRAIATSTTVTKTVTQVDSRRFSATATVFRT